MAPGSAADWAVGLACGHGFAASSLPSLPVAGASCVAHPARSDYFDRGAKVGSAICPGPRCIAFGRYLETRRFSCSCVVFRRSWPGSCGICGGSATAVGMRRAATGPTAPAPPPTSAIPATAPGPAMTPRDDHDADPNDRAVRRARPTFPMATGKALYRRLPPPITEIWDWQLRAACRGLDGDVFVHPDRERGPARAARENKAKQICRTCPVLQQCRRHALAVREPCGVWGGLSKPERDALLDRGQRPPLRVASPGSTARSGEPPPTPGPARTNHAGSVTTQPTPDVMLHTGIAALAARGRAVDLRLVPPPCDAAAGTPATAVPAAPTLIQGSREEPQEYLTVAEVAVMLRVSRATTTGSCTPVAFPACGSDDRSASRGPMCRATCAMPLWATPRPDPGPYPARCCPITSVRKRDDAARLALCPHVTEAEGPTHDRLPPQPGRPLHRRHPADQPAAGFVQPRRPSTCGVPEVVPSVACWK